MLAYAANRRRAGTRLSSPNVMLIVVGAHVAAVAVLMSARMDLPRRIFHPPTIVDMIPLPLDPPPVRTTPQPEPQPRNRWIDHPQPQIETRPVDPVPIDTRGPTVDPGPVAGAGTEVIGEIPKPAASPSHRDPRLLTRASELKPPYPSSKLLSEEEAVVTLRLSIDERGRVIAVEPVGRADPVFVDAARRHLLARWRYQPATEDGRPIASSLVVTLRFMLDG